LSRMVNISEPLQHRHSQQAKGADRLGPKRYEVKDRGFIVLCRRCGTSGVEAAPNRLGYLSGTRKPRIPPIFGKASCKGKPMGVRAQDDGKSECWSVMDRIRVQALPESFTPGDYSPRMFR